MIKYFALISIIISCLGLYAMLLYMSEKRYYEIGIRKTFGAGIRNIFTMVFNDLSILMVIAFIISLPFTWYGMKIWLASFAHRISPGIYTYLDAGLISILIGWLTIGYQLAKVTKTRPPMCLGKRSVIIYLKNR